jgi:hypothetical protein
LAQVKAAPGRADPMNVDGGERRRRDGWSAGWWAFGVQGGILCAALVGRHNILFLVFGLAFAIVSAWQAMDRLDDGPSVRSLVWVLIDAAVIGLAIGLATWVYPHGTAVAWVIIGIATVAAPWLASRFTGEQEINP